MNIITLLICFPYFNFNTIFSSLSHARYELFGCVIVINNVERTMRFVMHVRTESKLKGFLKNNVKPGNRIK